jgi:hypothetical protein
MTLAAVTEDDFRPISLTDRPKVREQAEFKLLDGSIVMGWRIYDSVLGKSFYWGWTKGAKRSSNHHSRWQVEGMTPIQPVGWRPKPKDVALVPLDPIARREAEVLVHRAILTDGTMKGDMSKSMKSTWDDSLHQDPDDHTERYAASELIARFKPEPRDVDNYEEGTVMRWFSALKTKPQIGLNDRQSLVALWAYGLSAEYIGGILGLSRRRVEELYRESVDLIWDRALHDAGGVKRLPPRYWS